MIAKVFILFLPLQKYLDEVPTFLSGWYQGTCILPYMNMWRGRWRASSLIGKRFRVMFLLSLPSLLCGWSSTKLFKIPQVTGFPLLKKHLVLSPASLSAQSWAGPDSRRAGGTWKAAELSQLLWSAAHWRIWPRSPDSCSSSMLFALRHWGSSCFFPTKMQLCYYFKDVGEGWARFELLLFPKAICLFETKKKKKEAIFSPNMKHCSAPARVLLVPSKPTPSWVTRHWVVTSSKRQNLWGQLPYPMCALLEPSRSRSTSAQRWGMSRYEEEGALLCCGAGSTAQVCLVGPPADVRVHGWSQSSCWPLSYFHGGVEQGFILG